ncbi:MAG: hypothetical protein ACFFKA_03775 [Candidatus Thorarchaeota archaeon]
MTFSIPDEIYKKMKIDPSPTVLWGAGVNFTSTHTENVNIKERLRYDRSWSIYPIKQPQRTSKRW